MNFFTRWKWRWMSVDAILDSEAFPHRATVYDVLDELFGSGKFLASNSLHYWTFQGEAYRFYTPDAVAVMERNALRSEPASITMLPRIDRIWRLNPDDHTDLLTKLVFPGIANDLCLPYHVMGHTDIKYAPNRQAAGLPKSCPPGILLSDGQKDTILDTVVALGRHSLTHPHLIPDPDRDILGRIILPVNGHSSAVFLQPDVPLIAASDSDITRYEQEIWNAFSVMEKRAKLYLG